MGEDKLKVLIVDDEKLVRTMIRFCIDWEELGYEVVEECESAAYALDIIEDVEPDIILTDICMPVIDGLEFARRVKRTNPAVRVIILTGHDEFDYASEGIKIGVSDYLLKPIDAEELIDTLGKVRNRILEERRHEEEFQRLRDEMVRQKVYMRERCLNELYHGADPEEIREQLKVLGMELHDGFFQVAMAGIFQGSHGPVRSMEDRVLYRMRASELLKEYVRDKKGMYVIQGDMQASIILNNQEETDFQEECAAMLKFLSQTLQCRVYIGVGGSCDHMEKIKNSYREAADSLQFYYMHNQSEVICFRDIYPYYDSEMNVDNEAIHKFSFYIRSGLAEQAKEMIDSMFGLLKGRGGQKHQVLIWSVRLIVEIETVLLELNMRLADVMPEGSNLIKNLFFFESMGEARAYLDTIVDASVKKVVGEIKAKEKNLVTVLCDYVEAHYTEEELSLSRIARDMYTNASYLSRVLKEKTGQTFRGYLFKLRMEKAMELLRDTDNKGYEVAEMVGIKDPHYFSVCFKKYTGLSVSDYKKEITM